MREAVEAAAEAALADGLRPDSALLFVGASFARDIPELLDVAIGCLGTEAIVGATGTGVLAAGREIENENAVAILAQAGLEAKPFLVSDLAGDEAAAGSEIASLLGGPPRAEDLIVFLPDPAAVRSDELLEGVCRELLPAQVVGAGAVGSGAAPLQWCGRRAERGGLAGMVLRAERPPRIGVTQACRPVTEPLRVTRTRGHWVLGIEDRPALDVYRDVARDPLAGDLRRAAAFLLVALPRDEAAPLTPGGYLVRHVVGFDEQQKAFAIADEVKPGDWIAFAQREPDAAREDLKAMLEQLGGEPPGLGLYFNCCARGAEFFGFPGLEVAYLERAFPDAPIAGLFGSCEIGPIAGIPELLTHTGVLALIDS
ncbi:MAG: FIST C-terminal domain-containing protein [Deltaproteobacteria bacterium]|nr:FIST C-terminal domain-containing protein [Deltaproteobacteria bacterium]